ncbi:hypothetical protein [Marinobacterium rhizophilum]|uniref:Uncharacterized protein n=1 Tax=Marinobacterium rhizophilum TaxID=420402 RepID=A0ABY5HKR1_9GAMM|nr:hypothetical protein [Marinobacterium rhizophilum]UTW12461.1 hypothetical protein KDW95_01900 [Marinobacterium rhizophilum]
MVMLNLALKSLKNRAGSATLRVLTIAIGVMWLLWESVEQGVALLFVIYGAALAPHFDRTLVLDALNAPETV